MSRSSIRFVLDGELVELENVDPTRTVLQYLREDLGRVGTKEGCAEGDCGACTVAVAELDGDGIALRTVNSCIQFLPTLDGKELITVESLARGGQDLHPVQRAMVEQHGSQCGFCTPGFVMSLFALYKSNDQPARQDIDDALAGNLCRCTGYRPIIAAAESMYGDQADADDWLRQPCGSKQSVADRVARLREIASGEQLEMVSGGRRFIAPQSLDAFANAYLAHPGATILAGGTDVGLWVTKQYREIDTIIYTGRVAELLETRTTSTHIEIGGAVTLSSAIPLLVEHYPGLNEMFRRFASPPIRNAGTLGGNVANGSPIGDSMPALMVLGATLILRKGDAERELALEDFYHDYQVNDLDEGEFVAAIRVPLATGDDIVSSQKWSKRFDQDISGVCTAYKLRLANGRVHSFRMACGGLAATIKRATKCEAVIEGAAWDQATIDAACAALAEDFSPISDMRASADIRLVAVQNLLRRFFLESRGEIGATVYTYGR